MHEGILKGIS